MKEKIDKITFYERQLEKLKNKESNLTDRSFNLTRKLLELNKGIISKIDLLLHERNSISIEFTKSMNSLHISIKDNHLKMLTFENEYKAEMKNLGFIIRDNSHTLEINNFSKKKVSKVFEIISVIIFDIFFYKDLDNPIRLYYT